MPWHKKAFRAIFLSVESYWQILLRKRPKVLLDFRETRLRNFIFGGHVGFSWRMLSPMIIIACDSQWQTKKKEVPGRFTF